ncbi:conserved hypothetical protein [Ricinus communis]|uniref:Uncharacterized protein n=1 Tax=Ricinus communis TaxID=3988 RepID=B9SSI7_RICCO|nr:conserved hypothetical protein [Ricinus communis]
MATSRGMVFLLLISTVMICSLFIRETHAECGSVHPDDDRKCHESYAGGNGNNEFEEDDDEFDDTYKVVNKVAIKAPMRVLASTTTTTTTTTAPPPSTSVPSSEFDPSGHGDILNPRQLEDDLGDAGVVVLGH